MYIYQSHMGGLYATDEFLEDTYCEQCGDSDFCLGYFDEEDPESIWNYIKPAELNCIGCVNDCENCTEQEDIDNASFPECCYSLPYVMNFIEENASVRKKSRVYLICKNKKNNQVFVNFSPLGYKFGEAHEVASCFCLLPELAEKIAYSIIPVPHEKADKVKFLKKTGRSYVFEFLSDEEPFEGAEFMGDEGWGGWIDPAQIKFTKEQGFLKEFLDNKG